MSEQPLISVGMPVYNGEAYVGLAIESILGQTCGNFELIISDNASTDQTAQICQAYAAKDPRIRLLRNERNLGASRNYNQVFAKAVAPYFRWSNADDLAGPNLHAECLKALEQNPTAALAYGKTKLIDAEGLPISDYDDALNLQQSDPVARYKQVLARIGLSNVLYGLMRTPILGRTALMGPGNYYRADISLITELSLYGRFIEIPRALFHRRMHSDAWSSKGAKPEGQAEFWNASDTSLPCSRLCRNAAELRAISRAPLSRRNKIRLYMFLLRRAYWKKWKLAAEIQNWALSYGRGRK